MCPERNHYGKVNHPICRQRSRFRREFLEQEGYTVAPAQTTAEARRILNEGNVVLAIVDIRLVDDDDDKDTSGLLLAKASAYRDIPKIILTGFPSHESAREALRQDLDRPAPAMDFLEKKEGPQAMIEAVDSALSVSRKLWPPLLHRLILPLAALLGLVMSGILAIVFGDPRWLFGTAALGIAYAFLTWWLATES